MWYVGFTVVYSHRCTRVKITAKGADNTLLDFFGFRAVRCQLSMLLELYQFDGGV